MIGKRKGGGLDDSQILALVIASPSLTDSHFDPDRSLRLAVWRERGKKNWSRPAAAGDTQILSRRPKEGAWRRICSTLLISIKVYLLDSAQGIGEVVYLTKPPYSHYHLEKGFALPTLLLSLITVVQRIKQTEKKRREGDLFRLICQTFYLKLYHPYQAFHREEGKIRLAIP